MYRKDQQNKIDAGLCLRCGIKLLDTTYLRCDTCRELGRKLTKERKQRLIAAGLCYKCGERPLETKSHCKVCYKLHLEASKQCRKRLKDSVFSAYGGYICNCCGENEEAFLSIDHINNDGAKHRKVVSLSRFYAWLKANNYPDGFQVLCMNCQWGKRMCGGICPHKLRISKILDFYGHQGQNLSGKKLEEIWVASDEFLEYAHDWVQWLFPLKEPSNFNPDAPLLTDEDILIFKANPTIQANLLTSFERYLRFFGLLYRDGEVVPGYLDQILFMQPNHNWFRITRCLTSLRLLGREKEAVAFYKFLKKIHEEQGWVSDNSFSYWTEAVNGLVEV